ncbi:MAG: response regulator [Myxococcales bacterium]|nr:response regulator [Myxococcales bacterium]MCB9644567.1 response regulator [Myxococcales bacterium]
MNDEKILETSFLVVDDHDLFRERLARALRERGLDVRVAASVAEARVQLHEDPPEKVVLDLRIPDGSGLSFLQEIKEVEPTVEVVVLTGYGSIATAVDAIRLGATNYLTKPADADEILAAFERGHAPPLEPAEPSYQMSSLARAEWEHIHRVLSDCGGNISKAARILGVHRRSLQRKLQKYPPLEHEIDENF